jgi:hypothetical protein
MNVAIPKIHPAVYLVAGLVVAYAVYRVVDKVLNPNKGTPYEGGGLVGTLGNITNAVSGGKLAEAGSAIGTGLYDFIHGDEEISDTLIFTFVATGLKGAVEADAVDRSGNFIYYKDGKRYRLKQDASGKRFATAI